MRFLRAKNKSVKNFKVKKITKIHKSKFQKTRILCTKKAEKRKITLMITKFWYRYKRLIK